MGKRINPFLPFIILFGIFLSGCLPPGQADTRSRASTTSISKEITYEKTVNKGDEFSIEFRLRDYKNAPTDYQSFDELEKSLINLSGKASFKVKEFSSVDEANGSKAVSGMTFYYAVYEFKGSKDNPSGPTINPVSIQQTGWDPAPQLVLVINGKSFYQNAYRGEVSRTKKINITYNIDVSQKTWVTDLATWIQDKNTKPILALKYTNPQGAIKYIKINY